MYFLNWGGLCLTLRFQVILIIKPTAARGAKRVPWTRSPTSPTPTTQDYSDHAHIRVRPAGSRRASPKKKPRPAPKKGRRSSDDATSGREACPDFDFDEVEENRRRKLETCNVEERRVDNFHQSRRPHYEEPYSEKTESCSTMMVRMRLEESFSSTEEYRPQVETPLVPWPSPKRA